MGLPDTIGVSYDISYSPNPLGLTTQLQTENANVKIGVTQIDSFSISVKPNADNGITDEMMSGVLWPLAKILSGVIADKMRDALSGMSFDIYTVPDIPITVEGFTVTMKPKTVTFAGFNGFLKITADVNIV